MLTLGFTNHYYTLWAVNQIIRFGRGEVVNGVFIGQQWLDTKYCYIQNLSMEYDEAVKKITERAGIKGFDENLELRGENGSFVTTVRMKANYADSVFSFGKLEGKDIMVSDDIWQIKRAMNTEPRPKTRVYARRRLLELGELVHYNWIEQVYSQTGEVCKVRDDYHYEGEMKWDFVPTKRKYALKWQFNRDVMNKTEGHFHINGAKVILELKLISAHSFEGSFGTVYLENYTGKDGNTYHYMGANPPTISKEDFVKVQGTVKHDQYKGTNQTKLQRIKIK
jgi:hypothetical protein